MDTVRRWMTRPVIVVPETLTLPEARQLLHRQRIRRLPVVNCAGQLVGIVTEGDIDRVSGSPHTDVQVYNLYHHVYDLPVRDIMTHPVVTVTPDTPISEVAQLLWERRIGGVPVVQDDRVVGVITTSDLFRLIIALEHSEQAVQRAVGALASL